MIIRNAVKIIMASLLLISSGVLLAQDGAEMMEKLKKLEKCMQGLDQTELRRLEKQSVEVQSEISALCASGQQAQAQAKAITFAEQMVESLAIKQFKKCAKDMEDMMPAIPLLDMPTDYDEINVCNL